MLIRDRAQLSRFVTPIVIALVMFGLGVLAGIEFNFDRHSYAGGVAYVTSRESYTDIEGSDPLASCSQYVESGMATAEGFSSARDFYAGCQDAYAALPPNSGGVTVDAIQ